MDDRTHTMERALYVEVQHYVTSVSQMGHLCSVKGNFLRTALSDAGAGIDV
jgi:hypothetical protein